MISAHQDEDYEGTHSFTVDIEIPSGPAMSDPGNTTVKITENDGKCSKVSIYHWYNIMRLIVKEACLN